MKKKKESPEPSCAGCPVFSSSLFKTLSPAEIDSVLRSCRLSMEFDNRVSLYREGELAHGVYCLFSGYVKIVKQDRAEKEHVVGLMGPGAALGVESLAGQEKYNHSAVTMGQTVACYIPKNDLLPVLKKEPRLFADMLKTMCQRLDNIEIQLTNIGSAKVRERLAALLAGLLSSSGLRSDNVLNIRLTVDDLADLLGSTKSSVYRLMKDFRENGLASIKQDRISILSPQGLLRIFQKTVDS